MDSISYDDQRQWLKARMQRILEAPDTKSVAGYMLESTREYPDNMFPYQVAHDARDARDILGVAMTVQNTDPEFYRRAREHLQQSYTSPQGWERLSQEAAEEKTRTTEEDIKQILAQIHEQGVEALVRQQEEATRRFADRLRESKGRGRE